MFFTNEKRVVVREGSMVALRKGSTVQIHQRDMIDASKTHVVMLSLDELRDLCAQMEGE